MAEKTIIAWCDHTFNIAWGCVKVSPGCKNCYADTLSSRYGQDVWGPENPRRTFGEKHWTEPLKWNKQAEKDGVIRKVFCSSMCDNFEDHPTITTEREKLWSLIEQTPFLHWQLLTKRPDRIAFNLPDNWDRIKGRIWMGTSIENGDYASRADHIRNLDCAIRFISYEPAIGPLARHLDITGIDWVIYGGESGPGYRPEDKQWARDMRDLCFNRGVAFFHKQSAAMWTERGIELDGEIVRQYPDVKVNLPLLEYGAKAAR